MISYLEKLILDNWENWTGGKKPRRLDFLKTQAGSPMRNKKVGFFVFNKKKPVIFVKTVRESTYNPIIEDGFEKLKNVNKYLSDGSVPKPVYLGNYEGVTFSLETAIAGRQFHSCKSKKDLDNFLGWFFRFQKLMAQKELMNSAQLREYVDVVINKFFSLYPLKPELKELIKETAKDIKKDIRDNLSTLLIYQHGDLTPDNVLDDNGKIRVIDWDNFGKIKLPLFDLLVFLQRWSQIRDVSFAPKYLDIINRYLEEFKADKRVLRVLIFLHYLLDFIRKKDDLIDYDKEYLSERLREIKELNF